MKIKNYFITGLVLLLPLTLTAVIVMFIFNTLTGPFLDAVTAVFERYALFQDGFLLLSATETQILFAKLLILACLFFICLGLGVVTRWFFFKTFVQIAEYVVNRIPFVGSIYNTCQDIIKTLFTDQKSSFKQVVLAKFLSSSYSIGFITREDIGGIDGTNFGPAIAVFVPTTPNPTSGFLLFYKKEDLIYLDMKVEDAFKYIVSCGLIAPPFKQLQEKTSIAPIPE